MFFLVTHTWDPKDEEQVSKQMIKLFYDCHYGLVGNPWPKLFNVWQDPASPKITALWESSNLQMLKDVFKERTAFHTDITHVRQLYPPHVGCYNLMKIVTRPEAPVK
ncbi:MAG: hypothetical protein NTW86_21485 [Candidatus Sumerlaeota bacterium]|nr:hypothetical protein [Candidatus Sumerlaeota bacterium]